MKLRNNRLPLRGFKISMHHDLHCPAGLDVLSAGLSGAQVEVVVPEASRVKTTTKAENRVLGIANSFTRPRGSARECVGACFLCNNHQDQNLVVPRYGPQPDGSGREPILSTA
jgi:hypothetical protein